jgi:hypothetical protein
VQAHLPDGLTAGRGFGDDLDALQGSLTQGDQYYTFRIARRSGRLADYSGWKAEKMIEVIRSAISALGIFTPTLIR